jgi:hypothetical protein
MRTCWQWESWSVKDHGLDVHAWFLDLYAHVSQGTPTHLQWRLPEWVGHPGLAQRLLPLDILRTYQMYHDCGKPFCREVDVENRQHFPGHAETSHRTWMRYAETQEDGQVGELIRMDMLAHTVKGDAIEPFLLHKEAPSLVLTGLAEIHSNANRLGQLDSDGFKIKLKQLAKVGKRMVAKF